MTTYRDRHLAGLTTAPDQDQPMNVAQLKTALAALDQPTSGNKAELEERLAEAQKTAASSQ